MMFCQPIMVDRDVQCSSTGTEDQVAYTSLQRVRHGFLSTSKIIELLSAKDRVVLDSVPCGEKNNVYFLVDERCNRDSGLAYTRRVFADDCGIWDSKKGTTTNNYFVKDSEGKLKSVYLKNNLYCTDKRIRRKLTFVPMSPQPGEEEVIKFHRYYATLKNDPGYRKRVTCVTGTGFSDVALIEYRGKRNPLPSVHGNSKSNSPYTRTDPKVMRRIGALATSKSPREVYQEMLELNSFSAPRDYKQVRDKKYNDAKKMKQPPQTRATSVDNEVVDLLAMLEGNPNVQQIILRKDKKPCLILYSGEQIEELKSNVLGQNGNVLGVSKTLQVGEWCVTPTGYKNTSIIHKGSPDSPIFLGPVFLHKETDFETYHAFFSHLRAVLSEETHSLDLKLGGNFDQSIFKAVRLCFPSDSPVLSLKLLRERILEYLCDDIGCPKTTRNWIANKLCGDNGITSSEDEITFVKRSSDLLSQVGKYPEFIQYFQTTLKPFLFSYVTDPAQRGNSDSANRIAKSLSSVLKLSNKWKGSLPELVEKICSTTRVQMLDLRRALYGDGNYVVARELRQFCSSRADWIQKSDDEKNELFRTFLARRL